MPCNLRPFILGTALLTVSAGAAAVPITDTLGNGSSGLVDGSTPTILELVAAQGGQAAPFDAGIGNELFGPNFSASWTHSYATMGNTILSASLTIGIADHDSQASGDQVASFTLDGNSITVPLNTLFEAGGGGDNEYNTYTLDLTGFFADLADDSVTFALDLAGPGLQTSIFNSQVSETSFNGAHLIFSTLSITTQDPQPPTAAPEPGTLALLALGLGAVGARRRKRLV